jgi:Carboxypeptidase regulatory-like domain
MIFRKGIILFTIAFLMLCFEVVFGQSTSGAISGSVLDPQGNVIPGATVKIKNLGTGAMRDVTSNSSGYYRVTGLAPGRYDVEGAAQGFATETRGVNFFGQGDLNTRIPQILPDGRSFFTGNEPFRNPNFSTIRSAIQGFSSNYNGLNLSANRRFNKGLQFQASYTFGKSLDNRSGNAGRQEYKNGQARIFDPFNRGLDYGRSDFDVRHNFTANVTYELPFGKDLKGIAGAAFSGWQVNSIVKLASGIPFTPLVDGDPDLDGSTDNSARADLVGDPNTGPRTPDQWYNLSAFAPPTVGFRGAAGRNIVTGPNFRTVDLSLNKSFALTEKLNLQLRAETFNLLNRANFDLPSNSDDGSQIFSFSPMTSSATASFKPLSTAGRISSIIGNARELQLGLKLVF